MGISQRRNVRDIVEGNINFFDVNQRAHVCHFGVWNKQSVHSAQSTHVRYSGRREIEGVRPLLG